MEGNGQRKGWASVLPWALAALFLCSTIAFAVAFGVEHRKRLDAAPISPAAGSPAANTTASGESSGNSTRGTSTFQSCSAAEPFNFTGFDSRVASAFDPFTGEELDTIAAWVRTNLSLAVNEPEDMLGDWLFAVEHLPTQKAAVLAHIDGSGPAPGRYARAIVYHLANISDAKVRARCLGRPGAEPSLTAAQHACALRCPSATAGRVVI